MQPAGRSLINSMRLYLSLKLCMTKLAVSQAQSADLDTAPEAGHNQAPANRQFPAAFFAALVSMLRARY